MYEDDLELELDFEGRGADQMGGGGKCTTPGWYKVVVEHVKRNDRYGSFDFEFVITEGVYKGGKIYQSLQLPGLDNDPDKEKKKVERLGIWAERLGVWDGKPTGKIRLAFAEAIGRNVVVKIQHRKVANNDTGEEKDYYDLGWENVYPPDHPKIPDDVRQKLRLPPARTEKPSGAAATANVDQPQDINVIANAHTRKLAAARDDLSDL